MSIFNPFGKKPTKPAVIDGDNKYEIWAARLNAAKKVHKEWLNKQSRYCDAYNNIWPSEYQFSEAISSNWTRRIIDTQTNYLWGRVPKVDIQPTKSDDYKVADCASTLINQVIHEAKVGKAFGKAVFNGLLYGSGWVKFGYHATNLDKSELEKLKVNINDLIDNLAIHGVLPPVKEGQDHEVYAHAIDAILQNIPQMKELLSKHGMQLAIKMLAFVQDHKRMHERDERKGRIDWRYQPQQIWCEAVDPREVVIDADSIDLDDAEFIAFRLVKSVSDLQNDKSLKNTDHLEGGLISKFQNPRDIQGESQTIFKRPIIGDVDDPNSEMVEIWEIWDRRTSSRLVLCEQIEDFLYDDESPFEDLPGFFPCIQIRFIDRPADYSVAEAIRAYGESQAVKWWPEQLQLNILLRTSLEITKHSVPRYVAAPGCDEDFLNSVEAGMPGAINRSTNPSLPIDKVFYPIPFIGNTPDILRQIQKLEDLIQFKSGWSEVQLLGASSARTATASQIAANSSGTIVGALLNNIEQQYIHAAKIIRDLIRAFYSKQKVVELMGEEGMELVSVSGSELMGSVWGQKINIEQGSSPQEDNMELQRAILIANIISKYPWTNQRELSKWLLSKADEGRQPNLIYSDNQWQQMQMQAQMQQMQGQGGAGPIDVNQANAQMAQMRASGEPTLIQPPQPPQIQQ